MTDISGKAGLMAALALIAATACGGNGTGNRMDDALRSDLELAGAAGLELAPRAGRQVVVSAIEGGPRATPVPAPQHTARPVQRTSKPTTTARPTSAPRPVPVRRQAQAAAPEPAPVPAPATQPQTQQRQPGVYSTEADVFRQMPWIRP